MFTLSYRHVEEIMNMRWVLLIMTLFSAGFINLRFWLSQRWRGEGRMGRVGDRREPISM